MLETAKTDAVVSTTPLRRGGWISVRLARISVPEKQAALNANLH
ncbi:hypothetical protein Pla100_39920 [Neorhodopirellula pilleata]|uniref:Uncharacterized protein n=1 Tax=Neorhodopirellula pilleata TaxID=2714738 RepID=A0A5C6A4T3_9BACT|nr:hypothetical protein Pla100_39920 [Neorhodopirellula pilleata]